MKRRNFLATMLAPASAPAIVRAESLMKIVVPPKDIFTFTVGGFTQHNGRVSDIRLHIADLDITELYPREVLVYDFKIIEDSPQLIKAHSKRAEAQLDWFVNRPAGLQAMRSEDVRPIYEAFMHERHPEHAKRFGIA